MVPSVRAPTAVVCFQHGKIPRPPNYLDHVNVIFFSREESRYNQFIIILNVILLHHSTSCFSAGSPLMCNEIFLFYAWKPRI